MLRGGDRPRRGVERDKRKRNKSPRFSSVVLYRLKFQRRGFQIRRPLGQVERLDANDFFFFVVIENYAGRDFLRFNDLGVIQPRR